jgi:hypothetical protein
MLILSFPLSQSDTQKTQGPYQRKELLTKQDEEDGLNLKLLLRDICRPTNGTVRLLEGGPKILLDKSGFNI